ncbi:heme biosynthesis protein HemY [Martelella sp. HB161492]|uniref:heme biosynthesis protein HemY n=1 Tax=Martelella sp. HB161492 TaxID=2720726 RepID=UPI001591B315|nr:heme biosynthesis protein HemY [Martelella sp. HB161492]
MTRLLVFALVVLGFGLGFSWFADRPGELSLNWQGQLFQTPLTTALAMLVALIFIIMLIWWLIRAIWTSPHSARRYFRARKRDRGYQAISTGLIAAGSGNLVMARKMSARAHALLSADQEPLIHVLDAQVALIEGDHNKARSLFEAMVDDPETEELGLRGLYLEARRAGADEAARQYAERAADKAPYLTWAAKATLETRSRQGRWDDALRLIDQQRVAKVMEKDETARLKSVILTARAETKLNDDPKAALADALQALKLRDDFHPAAIVAAKAYLAQDNLRKSAGVLEAVWKKEAHPQVAALYVRARGGDTATDRLKRAEKLETLKPNNAIAMMAVARAALDAREFSKAREKAEAAARMLPQESAFLLLADIEEAETADQGRIRHWMAQALKASRDPTWVADGLVSETWRPFSPTSGKLDAFQWKVPYGEIDGPVEEAEASRLDAALKTLPPVGGRRAETEKTGEADTGATVADDASEETAAVAPAAAEPLVIVEHAETAETADEGIIAQKPPVVIDDMPDDADATGTSEPSAPDIAGEKQVADDPPTTPFGGRAPDDPGVKAGKPSEVAPKKKLGLF